MSCDVGAELPDANYLDRKSRPKWVRYWSMQCVGGRFSPNDEVDEIRWLRLECVGELVTCDHVLAVIAGLHATRASVA